VAFQRKWSCTWVTGYEGQPSCLCRRMAVIIELD